MKRSILAIGLVLCLVMTGLPVTAWAERVGAVDEIVTELDDEFGFGAEEFGEEAGEGTEDEMVLPTEDGELPVEDETIEGENLAEVEEKADPEGEAEEAPDDEETSSEVEETADPEGKAEDGETSSEVDEKDSPEGDAVDGESSSEVEEKADPEGKADAETIDGETSSEVEETPVEAPIEAPEEEPVEAPNEAPVEAPVEAPIEAPVEAPVEVTEAEITELEVEPEGEAEVLEELPIFEAEAVEAPAAEATAAPAAEAKLALDRTTLPLLLQETWKLNATDANGTITWASEHPEVAAVDAEGVVTGIAVGATRIIATDAAGSASVCDVTVLEVPQDLAFETGKTLVLGQKEKRQAPGLVWDNGTRAYTGPVTYASSARKKVSVTAAGMLRGVARGRATLTATLSDGSAVKCTVTVKKAPAKITFTAKKRSMGVGETATLAYTMPKGAGGGVTWYTSNPSVVAVDAATGVLTAKGRGTATITAKTYNKKKAKATVSVYAAPEAVAFGEDVIEVGLGETRAIPASVNAGAYSALRFETANAAVASVGAGGRVTGVALGETQITVYTYNGIQATTTLRVKPAPKTISMPYTTLRIGKGDSVRVQADLGDGASALTCTSSKKKVVKVVGDGVIKGLKKGTAYVTVKTFNGKKARVKVIVKAAPTSVTASPGALNLGLGESYTLGYSTPSGTTGSATFVGDAPTVFSVNANTGTVTGLSQGSGTVTLTTYNGLTATCPVSVYAAPTFIAFDENQTSVAKDGTLKLQMKFDEGAWANAKFTSDNPGIAKVSADGVVTGVSVGQTVLRATTYLTGVSAETTFTVWGAPTSVWLDQQAMGASVGETIHLEPRIPVGSMATYTYVSSNPAVATVSDAGLVTAVAVGSTEITVTTHNNKSTTLKLTVAEAGQLSAVTLRDEKVAPLYVGDTWQVPYDVYPEGMDPQLTWSSSNAGVAVVDENGVVSAVGYGYSTIKAVPASNPDIALKFTLAVQTKDLTLVIPDRITGVDGIAANLKLINNIKQSTLNEIDALRQSGALSSASASRRKTIVENIFTSYAFPWMTPTKQKYWKAANSQNGLKDFKVGNVYYGLPYISGSGANRHYSAAQALSEGRYTDSGQGYYLLNQSKYLNGRYVGNDCSGLVNVAIWGTKSSHAADRTSDIYVEDEYVTVNSYEAMLPGDLLCKNSSHVFMFLYYASADRTKMMVIENGGSEQGSNTVHCDVYTVSSYKKAGYRVRRLAELG